MPRADAGVCPGRYERVVLLTLFLAVFGMTHVGAQEAPAAAEQTGSLAGVVTDEAGDSVPASVRLSGMAGLAVDTAADANGRFSFVNVAPGNLDLVVTAPGFVAETIAVRVSGGALTTVPTVRLRLMFNAAVVVTPSRVDVAERQIQDEEHQRVLGVLPNFYVSYTPDAAPLVPRQKFELWWRSRVDPIEFANASWVAGLEQARHDFPGFGDGTAGYAKRFAAVYATESTQRLFTRVVMPSIFKQDPRYFFKGEGPVRSRALYAVSRSVLKKGDNGHWQPNVSAVAGHFAGAAVSNFYYPAADRNSAGLIAENVGIGLAATAGENLAQEFLWNKLTTRAKHRGSAPE
jgi:hypothetical protein